MSNIVFTRIDDRLIHGQVMTSWVKHTQANMISIVDNEVANDPFISRVLKMAVPSEVKVDIYNTEQAIEALTLKVQNSNRIIILAKHPKTIYSLIKNGVDIENVNVGGMGARPGRKSIYKNISASQEEKEIFKEILSLGKKVYMQIVPDDKKVDIEKYL
mgnify:CR=1 FL=1|jgi:PTS system mannose-specific IIB component